VVAVASPDIFVSGIYTVEEAARLARLSPVVLRRWLDGSDASRPAMDRFIPKNEANVVGFVDFVQAMAIRALRTSRRLSLQKVRQTIEEAKKLGVLYPFARKHKTYLFRDDVVIELDDGVIFQVTGSYKQQQLIYPIVELYLQDLSFDPHTRLANRYVPLKMNDAEVVLDPVIQYGSPVVMPRGYTVSSLVAATNNEGSIQAAADMYGVPTTDVEIALRYEDILAGTAA
jgi:uncharacterized protein (DUF433 family)